MLELTKKTVGTVKELTSSSAEAGIRIFTVHRPPGQAPFAAAVVDEPVEGDEVIEDSGARVYLEPIAAEALATKVLDAYVAEDGTLHLQLLEP